MTRKTQRNKEIKNVLIANRGEIAVRIARSLKTLGIGSTAVYHAADARGPALRAVDKTVEISGETPVAAYLDGARIIEAARSAGADAIHPGYGFLSESADFAKAVRESGLNFIGPDAKVISLMGDKLAARDFVSKHGFPVAPSVSEADAGKSFAKEAERIGFPLMLKAAAGGGGKGMQIVREAGELEERLATAKSEAKRYFGDDRLYAERYVERPRHIEVQVLADAHGNVVHLGERECSIQRRFQKVIEEAPAPGLTKKQRDDICNAAAGIAEAAGYRSAGTVEFILAPDGEFYFLEMNTRLQVEHPVTEMITGIDLVEEQIRVARGEKLRWKQKDIGFSGHAIEARIYAEDPEAGFVPATGELLVLDPPAGPGLRWDGGFAAGQTVSAAFDPMIAKLIAHGADRDQAIRRLASALGDTVLLGVTTNTGWLRRLAGHPAFLKGETDTGFIERHVEELARPAPAGALRHALLAAAALTSRSFTETKVPEPHASIGHWRN